MRTDEISEKTWNLKWLTGNLKNSSKKSKMADRFAESNNILIQSLKDNAKNKNTQQSTNNWINVWTNRILVGGAC